MRYEVDPTTYAVKVFIDTQEAPTLYQPDYPDGTPWESAAEAESWVQLYVASVTDPDAPYAPNGRGLAGEPKPTPEQIAAMQAQRNAG